MLMWRQLRAAPMRAAEDVAPAPARTPANAAGLREIEIAADARGQYSVDAYVDGEPVRFLVDTGASLSRFPRSSPIGLGSSRRQTGPLPAPDRERRDDHLWRHAQNVDSGSIYVANVAAVVSPNWGA